ncbi:TonB-dependent vitamin B12 receptor [Litchfieldella qijiaojingensis]|uniref:TonB-dependent vitamin B12 receptor n=1 Tax=Litchfieldella qijiaojingensis TaxID=980347 RepID=A0ABQ2YG33_9GAMM|nr:TonB-dependent receptor [Halomonas qijiaojingensis]GGX82497.1 TonB-dependent vitamin B12 receptor [Halomonas qijiaojingensis]
MQTITMRQWGLAALCLGAVPLAAQAQTGDEDADSDASLYLNPLVVTATLAPRTANESLASVTVIDEETLRRQDPVSITDILRGQPGVDVSTNGSFGKNSSVFMRGTNSDSTVLMIDGIRLRSVTLGTPAWQFLDPRMFQRAEIVRGPRGSLYGADAVGGVVQLFTPEGEGGPSPSISVGGGSFDSQRYSATLSGSSGGTRYSFAGSRFSTDGTEVVREEGDKGYDNTTGFVRLSHTFDGGAELGVLGLRARGNTGFVGGETDFVQQVAGVYGELPVTGNWRSRLTLSEARDESDNIDVFGDSIIDTRTHTARWENTVDIGSHELIAGAEYSKDEVSGTTDYDQDSRDNTAVFAQGVLDFSPFAVQLSLRHDDNEAFGEETIGSLALGYDLDNHHTLRTSYGTAFKAPTFNQLFFPGFGNPELEAETSETFEVGMRGQYRLLFWDLAAYQTNAENLIANEFVNGLFAPFNVDETRIRGAEFSAGTELDDWTLQVALTYTDPEDRETGKRLRRRASQSLRLDIDRELGDWSLGGSWIVQNHRYEDADNEERLPGFGLVNLRAGWQFAPLWSARLTVENVLDKEYATARDFRGNDFINAGRAAFVSVRFGAQ